MRLAFLLIVIFSSNGFAVPLQLDCPANTTIFFHEEDISGVGAIIVGVVDSVGTRELSTDKEKEVGMKIQGKTKALLRLTKPQDIVTGSMLFIINERNLVVAKFSVQSVFEAKSFGYMSVGYGNFRNTQKDFRAVILEKNSLNSEAVVHVNKGFYYENNGDISNAITEYQKAILKDKNCVIAHSSLGALYLKQRLIPFAMKEYTHAYESIGLVYDKEDRYLIIKGCAETRYYGVFKSELPKGHSLRNRYITEGISFSKQAIVIFPESLEANYFLGMFYYELSNNDSIPSPEKDVMAVNQMLKVLKIDNNFDACMVLAKIYKRNNKKDLAMKYGKKATEIQPSSIDARDMFKSITAMK